ncbi:hypothetical protein [Clostridium argentinense]|uniref:hypothetical protein n=1 Tax=Clostridium argentinense TaxID=29341 RepID=UPI0036F22786
MLVNKDINTKRYKKPFINNNKTIGAIIVSDTKKLPLHNFIWDRKKYKNLGVIYK